MHIKMYAKIFAILKEIFFITKCKKNKNYYDNLLLQPLPR